jgi:hypothetical protein
LILDLFGAALREKINNQDLTPFRPRRFNVCREWPFSTPALLE